ncbi:MAG: Maf family protein [Acidobacteriota bacterium]
MLKEKIILASKSPRRAEILRSAGWEFESQAPNIDETRQESEDAVSYVKRLAREKAATIANRAPERLALGADTVVVIDGEILGQPRDDEDARRMLSLLSGKWHEVLTGVALLRGETEASIDHESTRVHFCELSAEEIDWYVSTGEPRDKAGAYAIQGKGAIFIEGIEGDYFNIVGLPIRLVYEMVRRM